LLLFATAMSEEYFARLAATCGVASNINRKLALMTVTVVPLPTLAALHDFVRQTLCAHDRLDPAVTPFFAADIVRGGRLAGYLFHIEGPRQMKNSAVWAEEEHRIFFYDSTGARFHEVRLSDSPLLEEQQPRRVAA
jgi:hypothetical protein